MEYIFSNYGIEIVVGMIIFRSSVSFSKSSIFWLHKERQENSQLTDEKIVRPK